MSVYSSPSLDRAHNSVNAVPPLYRILSEVYINGYGTIPVIKGDFKTLPEKVQVFIVQKVKIMTPKSIYICDGSSYEYAELVEGLEHLKYFRSPTPKGATDVVELEDARLVKGNTFFTTKVRPRSRSEAAIDRSSTPHPTNLSSSGAVKRTGGAAVVDAARRKTLSGKPEGRAWRKWMSVYRLHVSVFNRFPACMRGRILYVVPISLGPVGGYYSNNAVQLTDNPHVVVNLHVHARVSHAVWDTIAAGDFVKGIHSVGLPRPVTIKLHQDRLQNVKRMFIGQYLEKGEIWSFGTSFVSLELIEEMMLDYFDSS